VSRTKENDVTLTFILPWFPIILGVGVGGRILGRPNGSGLGILCALLWIVLVQTSAGVAIWWDPWSVISIFAGVFSIVAMGAWAGEAGLSDTDSNGKPDARATRPKESQLPTEEGGRDNDLERISTVLDRFDDWLEIHRSDSNPWPAFDEFIRFAMHTCCRATHVRPYRKVGDGEELKPLGEADAPIDTAQLSARKGIVGHVVTTGRSYIHGDRMQGELVRQLAEESEETIAWCFAIREGPLKIGAVVAGQIDLPPETNKPLLRVCENLVRQCWCRLLEATRSRAAVLDDPVSGAFTRESFLRIADESLHESYKQGEPVAVAAIALERLRELNDSGQWAIADEIVAEISAVLRRKIRMDDRLGRFDGSRFILLLRRVDSELASLIINQIVAQMAERCRHYKHGDISIVVRCGVAGSGTQNPDLRTLVSQALAQCRRAREENLQVASDLRPTQALAGAI
jgi:diguanylate cyclase (GGDEF)-like protein